MSFLWGGNVDPNSQSAHQKSFGDLNSVFNFAGSTARDARTRGFSDTGTAADYWRTLISGNRQQVEQAAAPGINAALSASDAAKREEASKGTGRTGGTNAINQERNTETRAQVDSLIGGVQPQAASALSTIGGTELSAMLASLGIGESAAGTTGYLSGTDVNATKNRQANFVDTLLRALL